MIRRGEVYWVNLDPVIGSEADKTRPGLVISNDINNENAATVTVLALSTQLKRVYPFEVLLKKDVTGLPEDSKAMAHQIRTVDKRRLMGQPLGSTLSDELMSRIESALKLHLQLS